MNLELSPPEGGSVKNCHCRSTRPASSKGKSIYLPDLHSLPPNHLIQLNENWTGKKVLFVHFVVCLFANSNGLKKYQEQSSKSSMHLFY